MKVLVTGANGFVGRAVVARLLSGGVAVRGAVRQTDTETGERDLVPVTNVNGSTDWSEALESITDIVHLVARTHVMGERDGGDFADYRPVNVDGTLHLAESAARAGLRRLVFVSSVKVNGERTHGVPFKASDIPSPEDAYGISKWEAEQALAEIGKLTGLETVVIRPPLIYGPYASGNFERLAKLVRKGIPLPLGAIRNRRSLVALPNLVDLVVQCLEKPEASCKTFMVSDGEDVSTADLIRLMAEAMDRRPRLVSVPVRMLSLAGRLTGRRSEIERLTGSLQVDISHTCDTLDWRPPVGLKAGIRQAVEKM